jgi:hypothetical protein
MANPANPFNAPPPVVDIRPSVQNLRSSSSEFSQNLAEPMDFIQQALDALATAVSELQDVVGGVLLSGGTPPDAGTIIIAYNSIED